MSGNENISYLPKAKAWIMGFSLSVPRPLSFLFFFTVMLFAIYSFSAKAITSDEAYALRSDFLSYYTAVNLIAEGKGEKIFNPGTQADFQHELLELENYEHSLPFKSIPPTALLYLPFSGIPYMVAYTSFALLNLLGFVVFVYILIKVLKPPIPKLFFIISFLYLPGVFAIRSGQTSVLLVFLFLGIYKFLRDSSAIAGLLSSFLLIKPQFVIIWPLLYFLAKEKRNFLKGLLPGVLIVAALSVLISGWRFFIDYPLFLLTTESVKYGSDFFRLYTFNSFLVNIGFSFVSAMAINVMVYLFFLIIFFKNYERVGLESGLSSAILITMAFSVHLQPHDLLISLLPIFILLTLFVKRTGLQRFLYLTSVVLLFLIYNIASITSPFVASFIFIAVSLILLEMSPAKLLSQFGLK